MVEAEAEAHA